jgi:hypothetical protein
VEAIEALAGEINFLPETATPFLQTSTQIVSTGDGALAAVAKAGPVRIPRVSSDHEATETPADQID